MGSRNSVEMKSEEYSLRASASVNMTKVHAGQEEIDSDEIHHVKVGRVYQTNYPAHEYFKLSI